jgi:hypothetical protein
MVNALRWIAVLPGAIVAFAIAQVAVLIGSWLSPWLPDALVQLLGAVVCPISALNAAIVIAPKFKFAVALSITSLMTGSMFVIVFLVVSETYAPSYVNKWWFLFSCGAGIVAPIWTCISLHHHDSEGLLPNKFFAK